MVGENLRSAYIRFSLVMVITPDSILAIPVIPGTTFFDFLVNARCCLKIYVYVP